MDEQNYKEVYFDQYCRKCKYWKENDEGLEEPCNECLSEPINIDSHTPVKFEEKQIWH